MQNKTLDEEIKGLNKNVTSIQSLIIENYFKIPDKYGEDELILNTDKEYQEICRALLCWINGGSHCIPDDFLLKIKEMLWKNISM